MRVYDLQALDARSFYGKAKVLHFDDGTLVLRSYNTDVLRVDPDGTPHRLDSLWARETGWSATTGRHVKALCGLNKAAFMALPLEHNDVLLRMVVDAKNM